MGLNPGSGTSLLGGGGGVVKALVSGSRGYGFESNYVRAHNYWVAVAEWGRTKLGV